MTVYLPDELHERVKAVEDLNVSAVCQAALEDELDRRAALAKLDNGPWEDVVVETDDQGRVVFRGRHLAEGEMGYPRIYLTQRHRFAVLDTDRGCELLSDYDTLDEATDELDSAIISEARAAMGDNTPVRLDI